MPDAKEHNPFLAQRKSGEPITFRRSMRIDTVDEAKRTVSFSFSSDVDLERWPGYFEKLDHSAGAVDLTRLQNSASALWNHDWDELCGVVDEASVDGGKGRCLVRFGSSARALEVWPDVRDKIIRNVSVGYEVLAEELTLNDETGCHYTVTRWRPYEVSFVTVPADISVGVGRTLRNASLAPSPQTTHRTMPSAPAEQAPATAAVPASAAVTTVDRFDEAKRILELGKKYSRANFPARELAADAVAEGLTLAQFQERLVERMGNVAQETRSDPTLGISPKEAQRFSFMRLIAADVAEKLGHGDAKRLKEAAAFERSVVDAAAAARVNKGRGAPKGLYIPHEILVQSRVALTEEQRAALAAKQRGIVSVSSGLGDSNVSATIQPFLDTASFAELLRPECIAMQLGTIVSGLEGPYEIPKLVSGSKGGWIAEDGTAPGQDAIFQMIEAEPNTVAGVIQLTRRAILTSALDQESILRLDLAEGIGQAADLAAYYGTGSGGQPTGLTQTDGIKTVTFACDVTGNDGISPEWTELVAMETAIGQTNVKIDPGSGAYVFNAGGRGWAKTRQKFPGTPTGQTIWENGGTINGYRTGVTNQVANGDWFLGSWRELFIPMWSGLDIIIDPFSLSEKARVRISAFQDMDYLFRRPQAFTWGKKFV
jgi:HK97 family phage major capsid protein/HK97 family phage prohead protease